LKDEKLVVAYLRRDNRAEVLSEGEDIEKITDGLADDFEAVRVVIDIEKKWFYFTKKCLKLPGILNGKRF
jgi:hypothetical protein|tara:strand:- start:101 stop:310 length:210 start_codon:yes stop_codon:yes gene_type:complete